MSVLLETDMPNLYYRGKVRDLYQLGDELLIVATDRISAFDSVLPTGIPSKGLVLNQLSAFWFQKTAHIVPNHVVKVVDDVNRLNQTYGVSFPPSIARRSMLVRKSERIPVECVVRGYISGSAWAEYQETGRVADMNLPKGLKESEKFPEPLFTPTTKAESGHDEPITVDDIQDIVGAALAQELVQKSLEVYSYAEEYARGRGIIIADTKLEFGMVNGQLHLIDELLTPDSSRFWDVQSYSPGGPQPSFDKQPVRDWLVQAGWNKEPPAPPLPQDVVAQTTERYEQAYLKLTGRSL